MYLLLSDIVLAGVGAVLEALERRTSSSRSLRFLRRKKKIRMPIMATRAKRPMARPTAWPVLRPLEPLEPLFSLLFVFRAWGGEVGVTTMVCTWPVMVTWEVTGVAVQVGLEVVSGSLDVVVELSLLEVLVEDSEVDVDESEDEDDVVGGAEKLGVTITVVPGAVTVVASGFSDDVEDGVPLVPEGWMLSLM